MTIMRFLGLALLLSGCDLAQTTSQYTEHCRALGGHTVAPFAGGGYAVLICVDKEGKVLEP